MTVKSLTVNRLTFRSSRIVPCSHFGDIASETRCKSENIIIKLTASEVNVVFHVLVLLLFSYYMHFYRIYACETMTSPECESKHVYKQKNPQTLRIRIKVKILNKKIQIKKVILNIL